MTLNSQTQRLRAGREEGPLPLKEEPYLRSGGQRLGAALTLGLAALAFARTAHAEFEVGAFGGYYIFSEKNRLGRYDLDPPATAFAAAPALGARFAYLPARYVAAEIQLSVAPTATRDGRASVLVIHGRAHLLGTLPLGALRPFVLVGLGAVNATPADPVYLRNLTQLNFHAGAGSRYDIGKWWGVRLDVQAAAVPRVDKPGIALEPAILLGLYGNFPWPPTPPPPFDADRDDITDDKDECPKEAGEIRFGGCPDPAEESEEESEGDEADESEAGEEGSEGEGAPAAPAPAAPAPSPAPPSQPTSPRPNVPAPPPPPRQSPEVSPSREAP